MVCQYGMSDRIGPISLGDDGNDVFLGRDFMARKEYSERKAQEIDEEVTRILGEAYQEARQCLAENRELLDRVSTALLERETLDGVELQILLEGRVLPPLPAPAAPARPRSKTPPAARPAPGPAAIGDKLPEPVPG